MALPPKQILLDSASPNLKARRNGDVPYEQEGTCSTTGETGNSIISSITELLGRGHIGMNVRNLRIKKT
jgi:hypothetical protein